MNHEVERAAPGGLMLVVILALYCYARLFDL